MSLFYQTPEGYPPKAAAINVFHSFRKERREDGSISGYDKR